MKTWDTELTWLMYGLFGLLLVASLIGGILAKVKPNDTIRNLNARIRA